MATKRTTRKTTKKAGSKKTAAVAKAEQADLTKANGILEMVNSDIGNAEIGKFFACRAGVGLLILKDMCPHGDWTTEITKAMPGRAPCTLRRYMIDSRDYLESKGVTASQVWLGLSEFDPSTMLTQGSGGTLLLAVGNTKTKPPKEAKEMADWLNDKIVDKIKSKKTGADNGTDKPKRLSRSQKREAAVSDLMGAITKINIALNSNWPLVDTETLDTVSASLTVAAATIKEELKKRG